MVDQYPNPPGKKPDINTQWPWVKDKWGDTRPEVVMKNGDSGPNYEKIAALRPDLIVAVYSEIDQAAYDKLSKIAPTVGRTKAEKEPFSAPWQDNARADRQGARQGGRGRRSWSRTSRASSTRPRRRTRSSANQTAVALSWYEDSVAPFTSTDVRGRLRDGHRLQGTRRRSTRSRTASSTPCSPPSASTWSTSTASSSSTTRRTSEALKKFKLFTNLDAVKKGKVSYLLDSEGPAVGAAISQGTLLSLPYAIDELVKSAEPGVSDHRRRVPPPAPATLRTATGREATRWVTAHCREVPWLTAATVLTTVAGAALQVLPVLLLGRVVDGVVEGEPRSVLVTIGVLIGAAALLGAAATAVSTYLIGRLGADLLARLREGAVRAVLGMPSARIEQVGRGDVLSRVGDDVAVLSKGIRTAVPTVFSAGVLVVIATVGMFGLDWRLGLAGAGALPAYALALRWYLPRSAPLYRKQRAAQADRAQALISGLNGIDTVRAYRLEGAFREKVTSESWRVRELGIEVFRFFGRFVGRENRAEFIGLVLILVVGYALLEADAASLGEVSAAPLMFHRLFTPLGADHVHLRRGAEVGREPDPAGRGAGGGRGGPAGGRRARRAGGRRCRTR